MFEIVFFLESALQHVSMFIRSMNNTYQIIEHLSDFGRIFLFSFSYKSINLLLKDGDIIKVIF